MLVDTCATARRTRLFLDALDAATGGAPIRLAVNTHLHGDHVYGNALLPDSTVIVAHEHTRQGILQDFILTSTPPVWSPTPDWGVDAVRAPTVSFRDEITLYAGKKPVVVRHPGYAAHTVGDAVAWLPEERVLFTGDLGEFAGLPDAERLVLSLHRAYADADGIDINVTAALGDAIAYNGGPLACSV